jgi:hypothetical protein
MKSVKDKFDSEVMWFNNKGFKFYRSTALVEAYKNMSVLISFIKLRVRMPISHRLRFFKLFFGNII